MMSSFLVQSTRRRLKLGCLATTVLALGLVTRLHALDQHLLSAVTHLGVLDLQLTGSAATLNQMLDTWRHMGVLEVAHASLYTDFGFMLAYSTSFALGCLLLAPTRRQAWTMAPLAWACALFDAAENMTQLVMLRDGATPLMAKLNLGFVCTKFALVTLVVGYLLFRVTRHLRRGRPGS